MFFFPRRFLRAAADNLPSCDAALFMRLLYHGRSQLLSTPTAASTDRAA
jgi:hypothetical protein